LREVTNPTNPEKNKINSQIEHHVEILTDTIEGKADEPMVGRKRQEKNIREHDMLLNF
jgi:hypothetical protein